jgi:PAS domain S-box-containing protein
MENENFHSLATEILNNVNSIILKVDSNGNILYINPFGIDFFGFSIDELIGQNVVGTIVPVVESTGRNLHNLVKQIHKNPNNFRKNENENIKKDGTRVWISWSNSALYDNNKNIIGLVCSGNDITHLKELEIRYQRSEEKFAKAFNSSPAILTISNLADGRLVNVNNTFCKYIQQSRENIIGKTPMELGLVSPIDRNSIIEEVKSNGCVRNIDLKYTTISGKELDGIFSFELIDVDNQPFLLTTAMDVTERNQVKNSLKENDERLQLLIDQMPISIEFYNLEGILFKVNQGWKELYQIAPATVLNKFNLFNNQQLKDKGMIPYIKRAFKGEYVKLPDMVFDPSESNLTGRKRWLSPQFIPIKNNKGKTLFVVLMNEDITERKELNDKIYKMEKLKIRSQKLESLALLAGGIAHDFNNTLMAILGNTQILQLNENLSEDMSETLMDMEEATKNASALTKQLLTFSKGGEPIKKIEDIKKIVSKSINFVMKGSKSKCVLDSDDNLPLVEVDKNQIEQVIQNLLINADQSMLEGGLICVNIEYNNISKSEIIPIKGDFIKISISDSGIGIPNHIKDRIFEPYMTTKKEGHGLGLATCYSIISRHNGHISFTSDDSGTKFHVCIPITHRKMIINPELNVDVKKFNLKVLIMEDNVDVIKSISKMLNILGISVELATNGVEAIEKYTKTQKNGNPFDLVFSDLIIPNGMGGKEMLSSLSNIYPNVIVIAMSGYSNDPIISDPKKFGFFRALQKPFQLKELISIFEEIASRNI